LPHPVNGKQTQPAARLNNPLARKIFKEEIDKEWNNVRSMTFNSPDERYKCYRDMIHRALQKTRGLPRMNSKSIYLTKLRQEQRVAHWKYKTLLSSGRQGAEVAR